MACTPDEGSSTTTNQTHAKFAINFRFISTTVDWIFVESLIALVEFYLGINCSESNALIIPNLLLAVET